MHFLGNNFNAPTAGVWLALSAHMVLQLTNSSLEMGAIKLQCNNNITAGMYA